MKMTSVGRNTLCAYISDVEEILKFKTFKYFKNQVASRAIPLRPSEREDDT
jgi:hypothetical protein